MKNKIAVLIILLVATACSTAIASCTKDDVIDSTGNETRELTNEELATQIMRNAIVISSYDYIYAFGISKMVIVGNKAYVNYGANRNKLDDDVINNNNESCCSEVNLHDMSINSLKPIVASKKYADGSDAPANSIIGYQTYTPTANEQIATFALMRLNNKNPYYCYAFVNPSEQIYNFTTCKLQYFDTQGHEHYVDYTINNYRQMLVDIGYTNNYTDSKIDYSDNINLNYNINNNMFYIITATNQDNQMFNFPLVFLESSDMKIWKPVANLNNTFGAGEISTIFKDNIIYITYRTFKNGMRWLIYDIGNKKTLDEGRFEECKNVLSKPDTFIFGNDVYMAVNVYPSVYGNRLNLNHFTVRQEINIYKIVNNKPEFFRKVYNPDGINYFSFCEAQNGRIYIAFSEDRRHLYKRLFSNVSFADVTEIFYN